MLTQTLLTSLPGPSRCESVASPSGDAQSRSLKSPPPGSIGAGEYAKFNIAFMDFGTGRFWKLPLLLAVVFLFTAVNIPAQDIPSPDIEAKIKVISSSRVRVEGRFLDPKLAAEKNWTFLQRYADVEDLGKRIDNLTLYSEAGEIVSAKKFAPGIYEASGAAAKFEYEVKIEPPGEPTAAAHVSWLTESGGLLMPEDLLPRLDKTVLPNGTAVSAVSDISGISPISPISARISLELPTGWQINTTETIENKNSEGTYLVSDISKSVFQVGRGWRRESRPEGAAQIDLITRGDWQFTDDEAMNVAARIFEEHLRTFDEIPAARMSVILTPFPASTDPGRWRAETRGSTVVLVSSRMPFQSQGLNRLHEQLRHEIFHFWVPNKLALSGSYDWFFEGFTLYEALKTGKKVGRIRFSDFLDTLGRAYTLSESEHKDLSLIDASKRRWDGNFAFINSRGMMVAFMCDAALLNASRGRRSLTNLFQRIYREHNSARPMQDGNAAILEILNDYPELDAVRTKYIEGKEKLDLSAALLPLGLEAEVKAGLMSLKLKPRLSGREKQLLIKLGLNPLYELPEKTK